MPAAVEPRVAVVTVSYNSSAQLRAFLGSVVAQSRRPKRIVIVDNASRDVSTTRDIADEYGAEVLELDRNLGYGGAVNAGVRALEPSVEFVLVSNPDVMLGEGLIETLLESAISRDGAGSIGPRILNEDGSLYPSARSIPSLRTGIGHAVLSGPWPSNPWSRSYRGERAGSDAPREAGWLSGSCVLVRRSAFEAIGGFDTGYFMYFEDVDLGYRFGRAGWRNVYEPGAVATHVGGLSTRNESERMLRAHHESAIRFIRTKYAARWLAPVRWALTIGLRIRLRVLARKTAR